MLRIRRTELKYVLYTNIVISGKTRLNDESKKLSEELQAELKELLEAKEIAIKLNNVLTRYTEKLHRDQLSQLKLSDVVTVKTMLRDKLFREAQGFRTNNSDYKDLEKISPEDIIKVINQIKLKIGQ
jgi:hypothetical protein